MLESEAKLLRADHTQQQQTGWLIWLTLCKTSKYNDKKKKRTWNYIGNSTEVHCVEKNTSQVKHFHWEMMQDDTKSMGLCHIRAAAAANLRQFGGFLALLVPNSHL